MPYTPPAQQSPAPSKNSSPSISRTTSFSDHAPTPKPTGPTRPSIPRSLSAQAYMQKHRRSPSISNQSVASSAENTAMNTGTVKYDVHQNGSIRQSPPPKTDTPMPSGALLSPPDSAQSSDDDESQNRGRQLDNLEELQDAVRRSIDVRKEGSPPTGTTATDMMKNLSLITSPQNGEDETLRNTEVNSNGSLTPEARKIIHSRSSSELVFQLVSPSKQTASPIQTSDSEEGDDEQKPPLLRKKSGELVKPALRPSSRRRYSSMPGTPTYSKAVHFNEDIEQVRHFLQVDRPIAVSAGSSPVEAYDSETEYPFSNDETSSKKSTDWELRLTNFPADSPARDSLPVQVERIYMSPDSKMLIGTVACQNLSFHKLVVARFTLDYWKTTSEVVAEYDNDVRKQQKNDGRDRFNFNIKLADQNHLENKTMLLCVRYQVNGQEFWDNNHDMNFQIDFSKKAKTVNKVIPSQGLGSRPLNAIPRSKGSPTGSARPRSMPISFDDDFGSGFDSKYRFGSKADLQDTPTATIRLKSKPKSPKVAVTSETAQGANAAFGTRYDFGASLSAALSNAQSALGDQSGLRKVKKPSTSHYFQDRAASKEEHTAAPPVEQPPTQHSPNLNALSTEKPPQNSAAYNELIQKYCFFGSNKASSNTSLTGSKKVASDSVTSSASVSGDTSPVPPPAVDGTNEKKSVASNNATPTFLPRSGSPTPMVSSSMGSRSTSPTPFGFPYGRGMDAEFHQPKIIHS